MQGRNATAGPLARKDNALAISRLKLMCRSSRRKISIVCTSFFPLTPTVVSRWVKNIALFIQFSLYAGPREFTDILKMIHSTVGLNFCSRSPDTHASRILRRPLIETSMHMHPKKWAGTHRRTIRSKFLFLRCVRRQLFLSANDYDFGNPNVTCTITSCGFGNLEGKLRSEKERLDRWLTAFWSQR